jgi:thiamine-phosphate pyrophosphorylase
LPERRDSSRLPFARLYPILDDSFETEESVGEAIAALGRARCRTVQLRVKELTTREFHRWAEVAREHSRLAGLRLIVNDRADIALLVGADGVHLGQEDLSPASARRVLGDDAVIGLSTHDLEQARLACSAPVDYIAIGPIFPTSTKKTRTEGERELGVEGARAVRAIVDKPLVAIGGITLSSAKELFDAGVDSVAVISALRRSSREGRSLEEIAREWLAL